MFRKKRPELVIFTSSQGKQHARVNEVPKSVESLNSGDIFVLDLNSELYLWAGKDANVQEKAKAREVILALKEARKGLPKVTIGTPHLIMSMSIKCHL